MGVGEREADCTDTDCKSAPAGSCISNARQDGCKRRIISLNNFTVKLLQIKVLLFKEVIMKKFAQLSHRIISLFLAFALLIQQYGCVTSSSIQTSSLPSNDPTFAYAVHCHKSVYIMEKIVVRNDTLSGKVFNRDLEILQTENFIHIYPYSDSSVKINSDKILSIPLAAIEKAKGIKEAPRKTAFLVLGGLLFATITIIFISLGNSLNFTVPMGP